MTLTVDYQKMNFCANLKKSPEESDGDEVTVILTLKAKS